MKFPLRQWAYAKDIITTLNNDASVSCTCREYQTRNYCYHARQVQIGLESADTEFIMSGKLVADPRDKVRDVSPIKQRFEFESESSSAKYETILYADGSTSCNCKGWTRRVGKDGARECKHTLKVLSGITARSTLKEQPVKRTEPTKQPQPKPTQQPGRVARRFDFD